MKKFLMLFAMVVMGFLAVAQTTPKISYQAVVRDNNNRLVTNELVKVEVTIGSFSQTFQGADVKTNANGLISLLIGDASAEYKNIDWSTASIYTKVTILSSSEYVESTVPVTAVPYALNGGMTSADSAKIFEKIYNDSVAIMTKVHQDSVDIMTTYVPMLIGDSLNDLRDTVAKYYALQQSLDDTAATLRSELKIYNDTLFLVQGTTDLGYFTANADANVTIDVKTKFTHEELVDTVEHFLAATTEAEMAEIVTAIRTAPQYTQFADSVADLVADYAIDYHDRMVALGTRVLSDYAANTTTSDFKRYYDSLKHVLSLVPASHKQYVKEELKARMQTTEAQNTIKEFINALLETPGFATWIKNNSNVQSIVVQILNTTAVQDAIEDMIVAKLGGNPSTDDVDAAVTKMIITKLGGDPATDTIEDAITKVAKDNRCTIVNGMSMTIPGVGTVTVTCP